MISCKPHKMCPFAMIYKQLSPLLLLAFLMFLPWKPATGQTLSAEAQISILTAGPGEDLYSVFGHSAMRVNDPKKGIDEVYNWGTFDFNMPNFYYNFARGRLLYMLTVSPIRHFLYSYQQKGRWVHEQSLNLQHGEKQQIYDLLLENRQPENVHYLYDFFYDNCATRVRDILDDALKIDWGPDPRPLEKPSFRSLLAPYVAHIPWTGWGIDLLLGLPGDKKATPLEYMYLPDELFVAANGARHQDGRLLVDGFREFLPPLYTPHKSNIPGPIITFWLLFILGVFSLLREKASRVFARIFFGATGLLGTLLFYLWFFSDHESMSLNLDILWAFPTHIYFVFRTLKKEPGRLPGLYFQTIGIICLLLLIAWPFSPQGFHPATFPLVGLSVLMAIPLTPKGDRLLRRYRQYIPI